MVSGNVDRAAIAGQRSGALVWNGPVGGVLSKYRPGVGLAAVGRHLQGDPAPHLDRDVWVRRVYIWPGLTVERAVDAEASTAKGPGSACPRPAPAPPEGELLLGAEADVSALALAQVVGVAGLPHETAWRKRVICGVMVRRSTGLSPDSTCGWRRLTRVWRT